MRALHSSVYGLILGDSSAIKYGKDGDGFTCCLLVWFTKSCLSNGVDVG